MADIHRGLAEAFRKLGMTVLRNPSPEPPWQQVVGVLDNPKLKE